MWVTRRVHIYPGEPWGFDNGAYGAWRRGEQFPDEGYRKRLEAGVQIGIPQLAVVPDIVGEGERSLEFSLTWRRQLPDSWPWYLAVQDGMRPDWIRPHVQKLAGIFLGGTDRFKQQAAYWATLARQEWGIGFHYGRASSFERLEHALDIGATSADTTNFMWTTKKWRRLKDWWDDSRIHQHHIFRRALLT